MSRFTATLNSLLRTRTAFLAVVVLVLASCQTTGSKVSVDYYQIDGASTADLDKEIRRKGPMLGGGRHAVAVARIKMVPRVKFGRSLAGCSVKTAEVDVDAQVTLPAFKGRARASAKLGRAWDNIDRYTRLHEAVHVAIAFQYAKQIKQQLLAMAPVSDCAKARKKAWEVVNRNLKAHDKAQKKFDADEQERIAKLSRKRNT